MSKPNNPLQTPSSSAEKIAVANAKPVPQTALNPLDSNKSAPLDGAIIRPANAVQKSAQNINAAGSGTICFICISVIIIIKCAAFSEHGGSRGFRLDEFCFDDSIPSQQPSAEPRPAAQETKDTTTSNANAPTQQQHGQSSNIANLGAPTGGDMQATKRRTMTEEGIAKLLGAGPEWRDKHKQSQYKFIDERCFAMGPFQYVAVMVDTQYASTSGTTTRVLKAGTWVEFSAANGLGSKAQYILAGMLYRTENVANQPRCLALLLPLLSSQGEPTPLPVTCCPRRIKVTDKIISESEREVMVRLLAGITDTQVVCLQSLDSAKRKRTDSVGSKPGNKLQRTAKRKHASSGPTVPVSDVDTKDKQPVS